MYKIKFNKKDKMYFYLYEDKKFIKKFLSFLEFYYYIRENNIKFEDIKLTLNFDLLIYHFVDIGDCENRYKTYSHQKVLQQYNQHQERTGQICLK